MGLLVEKVFRIGREVFDLELEKDGIEFYSGEDSESMAVVRKSTGEVIAMIKLRAFHGEGGGGSLYLDGDE